MWTRVALVLTLVSLVLAACGDDGGTPTTTGPSTSTTIGSQATTSEAQTTTTTEPLPTTTTLGTTTLAEGAVHFSGEGAFASEPFSLPGPSARYIVEMTADHIGDGWCGMVVRIEKAAAFGPEDVYWWLTYSTPDDPGIVSDTQELASDVLPSDEFRLVTEPSSEDLDDCSWEVTLRPA
jgi:hypothetical protein